MNYLDLMRAEEELEKAEKYLAALRTAAMHIYEDISRSRRRRLTVEILMAERDQRNLRKKVFRPPR